MDRRAKPAIDVSSRFTCDSSARTSSSSSGIASARRVTRATRSGRGADTSSEYSAAVGKEAAMAVAMFMEWPGVTQQQYEAVLEELDLDRNPADGALLHVASITPEGLRVVDLWESAEAFDEFSQERMMPAVQHAGVDTEPTIAVHRVHNIYAPDLDALDAIAHMGPSSMDEGEESTIESDEESEAAEPEETKETPVS
jgi:hypothetical protein